jgi:phosphotransacetylase
MAHPTSNYRKLPQIRLCAMLINEIKALSNNNISKFSSQKAVEDVRKLLSFLKTNNIIADYTFEAYSDQEIKGKLYFDISVTSSLGLKKMSFSISSGKAA